MSLFSATDISLAGLIQRTLAVGMLGKLTRLVPLTVVVEACENL
jgi:hypothetical protein